jgi:hypothetical protein
VALPAGVIRNPEKRKVGGSTPPLTTRGEQRKHAFSDHPSAIRHASSLIFSPSIGVDDRTGAGHTG